MLTLSRTLQLAPTHAWVHLAGRGKSFIITSNSVDFSILLLLLFVAGTHITPLLSTIKTVKSINQ